MPGLSSRQIRVKTLIDQKQPQTAEEQFIFASQGPLHLDTAIYPWHIENKSDLRMHYTGVESSNRAGSGSHPGSAQQTQLLQALQNEPEG